MPYPKFIEAKQATPIAQGPGYRLTFAAPSSMLPGDQLIAVIANDGTTPIALTKSTTWAYDDPFFSGVNSFRILRRIVTDAEPSSYYFDVATATAIGALLVYRYLANANLVSIGVSDFAATTYVKPPAIAVARYTDLYLFGAYVYDNGGGVLDANVFGQAAKRSSHAYPTSGSATRRLVVGEHIPKLAGPALAQDALGLLAVKTSTTFDFVAPGIPTLGADLTFSPIVPGAIGLPIEGV